MNRKSKYRTSYNGTEEWIEDKMTKKCGHKKQKPGGAEHGNLQQRFDLNYRIQKAST